MFPVIAQKPFNKERILKLSMMGRPNLSLMDGRSGGRANVDSKFSGALMWLDIGKGEKVTYGESIKSLPKICLGLTKKMRLKGR